MPDQHPAPILALPPATPDLPDLLRNVQRGARLCELHGQVLEILFAEPVVSVTRLRRRLLGPLSEMRVLAAAVAGQS